MTPFAIFFLRQFFLGISREVEEAAMIDGAGTVRIFFRLILPMTRGADRHAGDPDLHQRPGTTTSGRCWSASTTNVARAHRRARRLQVADAAGRPGLGRPDGGHAGRRAADAAAVHGLRPSASSTPSASPGSSEEAAMITFRRRDLAQAGARRPRRVGALPPATAAPRRAATATSSSTGCGTPPSSRATRSAPTRSTRRTRGLREHLAVRLGRLLVQAHGRVHRRHRARRVHRPPRRSTPQFADLQGAPPARRPRRRPSDIK